MCLVAVRSVFPSCFHGRQLKDQGSDLDGNDLFKRALLARTKNIAKASEGNS